MKEVKTELLIAAAKELNELLFDPEDEDIIDVKLKPDELCMQIKDAAKLLDLDDELTKKTTQVLADLGISSGEEDEAAAPGGDDLTAEIVMEIEAAERMKDLKDIAKSYDEFKEIRGKLSAYKSKNELRKVMLKVLDKATEKSELEKATPVKKGKEKAKPIAKKAEPEKTTPEKKVEKPITPRSVAVAQAIRTLCKRGATMLEIMDKGDEIYVEAGGKSNPTATNVNRYTLNALVEFGILSVNDNGKYKFVNK